MIFESLDIDTIEENRQGWANYFIHIRNQNLL